MNTGSGILYRFAKVMSILGHPLLTVSLLCCYTGFLHLSQKSAIVVCGLLIITIVIPVVWHNYRKVIKGQYTNFDVSNQDQRARFYPLLIGLTLLFLILLAIFDQPRIFVYGTSCMLFLLVVAYYINVHIKSSLHTSISIFIAIALYTTDHMLGLVIGIFAILIALSRLILKRHTMSEIVVGGVIGGISGFCLTIL